MRSLYAETHCRGWWSSTAPDPQPDPLTWPAGWVRCAWCKKIALYGSPDIIQVKRKRGTVFMHARCAHEAELHDWGNAPPMHGAD